MMKPTSKWKLFKTFWLVPNYRYSRGPARWVYEFKEWWNYNMDSDNCCGLLHKIIEWKDEKLAKWLTPQLKNAREFLAFCREENDTKLLWYKANFFRVRTRDENQYYFNGWANWLGKVTITRSQWLNVDGNPENLFMWGVSNILCKDDESERKPEPVEKKEVIFSRYILTKNQLEKTKNEILQHLEFGWSWMSIAEEKLAKDAGMKTGDEIWKWKKKLEAALMKKEWNTDKSWIYLENSELEKFEARICSLTLKEALELVG